MIYVCLFILVLYIIRVIVHDAIPMRMIQRQTPLQTCRQMNTLDNTAMLNDEISKEQVLQEFRDEQNKSEGIIQEKGVQGDVIIGKTQSANSQYIRASFLNDDFLVVGQCSKSVECCQPLHNNT